MLEQLTEVRPGRRLYVKTLSGDPTGALAQRELVALLLHGALADSGQVCVALRQRADFLNACRMSADVSAWQYDEQVKALIEEGISTVTYDAFALGQSTTSRPCDRKERLRLCGPHEYLAEFLAMFDQFTQGKARLHSFELYLGCPPLPT